jgi:hypothetical protein
VLFVFRHDQEILAALGGVFVSGLKKFLVFPAVWIVLIALYHRAILNDGVFAFVSVSLWAFFFANVGLVSIQKDNEPGYLSLSSFVHAAITVALAFSATVFMQFPIEAGAWEQAGRTALAYSIMALLLSGFFRMVVKFSNGIAGK